MTEICFAKTLNLVIDAHLNAANVLAAARIGRRQLAVEPRIHLVQPHAPICQVIPAWHLIAVPVNPESNFCCWGHNYIEGCVHCEGSPPWALIDRLTITALIKHKTLAVENVGDALEMHWCQ